MQEDWRTSLRTVEDRYTINGKKVRIDKHRTGEPYLCKKCDRVWQPYTNYNLDNPEFLGRFPKIGCTTLTCSQCK